MPALFFSMLPLIFRALIPALLVAVIGGSSVAQPKVKTPGDPVVSAQQGLKLAREGHCEQSLPLLRKALVQAAEKELKRQVGFAGIRCAMSVNLPDTALEFLRFLIREFPRDPDVLYISVHTYSDLSTGAAQQLAALAPDSSQAHKLNAEAFELQGKWDQAEKEYRRVLQQDPHVPGIHFRMARIFLSKPDPGPTVAQDAKQELLQEIEIDPSNEDAEYVLGELARQDSQWQEAIDHFTRASKLDAGFGDAFLGLGISLFSAKRFSEAIPPLETAVKLEPKNPGAHYNLAQAYNRAGRKQDADREFAVHRQMTGQSGAKTDPPQAAPAENSN
jgi:tetratricopeptide (TPR) repeat protein